MDRQQMERCLEQVAAYRASGQKAREWAEANGVPAGTLQSWCAHAKRWQAQLDGVSPEPARAARSSGFVAARVAPSAASASVRVELNVVLAVVSQRTNLAARPRFDGWAR